jgi:hypothetical protein
VLRANDMACLVGSVDHIACFVDHIACFVDHIACFVGHIACFVGRALGYLGALVGWPRTRYKANWSTCSLFHSLQACFVASAGPTSLSLENERALEQMP